MSDQIENVQMPPSAIDVEEALLGSILIDPDNAMMDIAGILKPTDFYRETHRWIFEAFVEVHEKSELDFVTACATLKAKEQLEEVGGEGFIIDLMNAAATSINAKPYALIIREKSRRREMIAVSSEIVRSAYEQDGEIDAQIDAAQAAVIALSAEGERDRTETAKTYTEKAIELMLRAENGISGLSSGFPELDRQIGGFGRGEMHAFAAENKVGKSTLLWQVGLYNALKGKTVVGIDAEMTQAQLALRFLSQLSLVRFNALRQNSVTADERDRLNKAAETLASLKFPIHSERGITPAKIRASLRRQQSIFGGQIDLVIVDYYQLLQPSNPKIYDRTLALETISHELTTIAGDFDCTLLLAAQVNSKQVASNGQDRRPKPHMVSRSDALSKDCHSVHTLFDESRYQDDTGLLEHPYSVEIETHASRNSEGGRVWLEKDFAYRCFKMNYA